MKGNHSFSFLGGEALATMGAWWFVSYAYYLHIDKTHFAWRKVKTAQSRACKYRQTKKYHVYWLCEVLAMERLDVHGNGGGLMSSQIKQMARELLAVLSKDGGQTEMQVLLDGLEQRYQQLKHRGDSTT